MPSLCPTPSSVLYAGAALGFYIWVVFVVPQAPPKCRSQAYRRAHAWRCSLTPVAPSCPFNRLQPRSTHTTLQSTYIPPYSCLSSLMSLQKAHHDDEPSLVNEADHDSNAFASDDASDSWAGVGSEQQVQPSQHHPPSHAYRPPTGEELRDIKDAADLYRSSSFKFQVHCRVSRLEPSVILC